MMLKNAGPKRGIQSEIHVAVGDLLISLTTLALLTWKMFFKTFFNEIACVFGQRIDVGCSVNLLNVFLIFE